VLRCIRASRNPARGLKPYYSTVVEMKRYRYERCGFSVFPVSQHCYSPRIRYRLPCGLLRKEKPLTTTPTSLILIGATFGCFRKKGERDYGRRGDGGKTVLVGWEEMETRRERSLSVHSPNEFLLLRTDDYEITREANVISCAGIGP
jgi:hypothetical protein